MSSFSFQPLHSVCASVFFALNVTVWLQFNSTPSVFKVLQAGARSTTMEEGKMAREPARFLSLYWTRGRNIMWLQEGKYIFSISTTPDQLMIMWHQHMPHWRRQASLPCLSFSLSLMSHKIIQYLTKWRRFAPTLVGFRTQRVSFLHKGMSQLSKKLEQSKGHANLGWSWICHCD